MITDLFDGNIAKILTLFSISPGSKFSRNEIKEKTMLNNVPLDGALDILLHNNLLLKEKRLYSLNFENNNAKEMVDLLKKEHIRFKQMPLNTYYILIDVSSLLSKMDKIERVYLFGSFAKLIYTEKSDLDLAIVLKEGKKEIIGNIRKDAAKVERKYSKPIEFHFFDKEDMNKKDILIKEIKKNSIILF